MKPSKDISRLLEIMQRLRDPETGCAWDVEQTFETIAPYTIEEAYEVADAIERNDLDDLVDELGDLLLQVVFHAQMARDQSAFDFGDVVHAITSKMIRRHPHVFGPEGERSAKLAKGTWERIKAEEKALKASKAEASESILDDVPRSLPSLMRAVKLQKKAATVGFDWSEAEQIFDKMHEETEELREAISDGSRADVHEEFGDLLFVMANLGRHLDIDPEATLSGANQKFKRRFAHIEKRVEETGSTLDASTLEEMEAFWIEAKNAEKNTS
ncbi:MAG: nucleoside triphosphate pyrophosphohydrolase [Pseudomonadota bacterium]